MVKKTGIVLLVSLAFMGHAALSASEGSSMANLELTLNPGQTLVLTNTTSGVISAQCLISAVDTGVNTLVLKMIKGKGSFNGTSVVQGATLYENIRHLQNIPIKASVDAKAQLTNLGSNVFKANCS